MSEMDILTLMVGDKKLIDLSAIEFLQWMSKKISGISPNTADGAKLSMRLRAPAFSSTMAEHEKIDIVRAMERLGITLP